MCARGTSCCAPVCCSGNSVPLPPVPPGGAPATPLPGSVPWEPRHPPRGPPAAAAPRATTAWPLVQPPAPSYIIYLWQLGPEGCISDGGREQRYTHTADQFLCSGAAQYYDSIISFEICTFLRLFAEVLSKQPMCCNTKPRSMDGPISPVNIALCVRLPA